jgi:hypothetical protein
VLNGLDEWWGIQILIPSNPTLGIHFSLDFWKWTCASNKEKFCKKFLYFACHENVLMIRKFDW